MCAWCSKPLVLGDGEESRSFAERKCCRGTDCANKLRAAAYVGRKRTLPPASRPIGSSEWRAIAAWPEGMRFEDAETDDGFIARIDHPATDIGAGGSSLA